MPQQAAANDGAARDYHHLIHTPGRNNFHVISVKKKAILTISFFRENIGHHFDKDISHEKAARRR